MGEGEWERERKKERERERGRGGGGGGVGGGVGGEKEKVERRGRGRRERGGERCLPRVESGLQQREALLTAREGLDPPGQTMGPTSGRKQVREALTT